MRQEVQTIKSSLYIYQAKHCKKCGSQVPHFSNASPLAVMRDEKNRIFDKNLN